MAATVIDALVVMLGLDPTDYDKNRKKVEADFDKTKEKARKTAAEVSAEGKKGAQFFSQLRGEALALFAVFTAGVGLTEFVKDITVGDAQMGRFAKTLDTTTEELSRWRNIAVLTGGSAEGMQGSMQALTDQFQQFQITGESSVIPYFRALGVQISDLQTGKMRPLRDILLDLADRFQGMDPARASTFGRALGLDPGTVNTLLLGRKALQDMLAEQERMGHATKESAAAGAQYQKAMGELEQTSASTGRTLLVMLAPALIAVLKALKAVAQFLLDHKAVMIGVFTALTVAVLALSVAMISSLAGAAIGAVAGGFAIITGGASAAALALAVLTETVLPALSAAFLALGAAIELTPIGWIITAIAALVAIGYELYENWDSIARWWRRLWGGMGDDAETNADRIKRARADAFEDDVFKPGGGSFGSPVGGGAPADFTGNGPGGDQPLPYKPGGYPAVGEKPPGADEAVWRAARASEARYGIPASVTYAQWALESGRGRHMPAGSNNPFGIKARAGEPYVEAMTTESIRGQNVRMMQRFRKFDTLADAFEAHAKLLATAKVYAGARAHENDPGAFADALTGVYATDPTYGAQLRRIMAGTSARGIASKAGKGKPGGNTHNETKIASITVHTKATDAKGIARDIGSEIADHSFAANANTGFQ